jgi:hypothetical protein
MHRSKTDPGRPPNVFIGVLCIICGSFILFFFVVLRVFVTSCLVLGRTFPMDNPPHLSP